MKKTALTLLLFAFSTFIFAQNEKRLALVVGNSAYLGGSYLKNPVNDANLMARTLQGLGFTVIKKLNTSKASLERAIYEYSRKLKDYDVALFYYAGHGIQVDGKNYIIPIDAKLSDKTAVKFEAVAVNYVVEEFESYRNHTNIVILDACRDNPFRSWGRGGARGFKAMNPASGTIIAFATSEGSTAADGTGSNGLYTTHLSKQLKIPQSIESVFKKTRVAVQTASNGKQSPQEWTKLTGDFYFKKPTGNINNNQATTGGFVQGNVVLDYGSISIDSKIAGSFYLDGQYKGNIQANSTGNRLSKIKTGSHSLKIEGDETWSKTITVYKDQTKYVTVKSNKPKDLPGYLNDTRDGKSYKILEIGSQVWMAENLAFETASGSWAYDNSQSNVAKYGYIYNWETAKTVCPSGWHLPSDEEWKQLEISQGMSSSMANKTGWRGDAGKELKSTSGWYSNGNGNNSSGFSALPGGKRYSSGSFNYLGESGYFWSSSPYGSGKAWYRTLGYIDGGVNRYNWGRSYGYSVRCLQD